MEEQIAPYHSQHKDFVDPSGICVQTKFAEVKCPDCDTKKLAAGGAGKMTT